MDIQEFLLARIAEDEEAARAAIDPSGWGSSPDGRWRLEEVQYEGEWPRSPEADDVIWADSKWALHANIHDPARVLRECAGKREIIRSHQVFVNLAGTKGSLVGVLDAAGAAKSLGIAMRSLSIAYSDHPDYQEEWKP